jgi:hypothetical protein
MVLAFFGIRKTQRELARLAKTDKEFGRAHGAETGTSILNIVATLRAFGLKVEADNHRTLIDIKRALRQNKVPIVCFTERKLDWGHYAIVIGFRGIYIELLDPAEPRGDGGPMTITEFRHRWNDPVHTKTIQWAAFIGPPKTRKAR